MRTVAIIQARMGSTRLPGKVMLKLGDRTVLERVVERVNRVPLIDEVIVATTDGLGDEDIVQECTRLGVSVFRGSESDVLDRYYKAAVASGAEVVVRVTADCPLIDPRHVNALIIRFCKGPDLDYVGMGRTYPEGFGAEVFGRSTLETAWREASLQSEREHVTAFIWKNTQQFRLDWIDLSRDFSKYRLTLDEGVDLQVLEHVVNHLEMTTSQFSLEEIIKFLVDHPEIARINSGIARQKGYLKSILEESDGQIQ